MALVFLEMTGFDGLSDHCGCDGFDGHCSFIVSVFSDICSFDVCHPLWF